jgi:hypothetical protein
MDGRINLAVDTHTPSGIIQPFRNLGGMFDLGWPHLGEVLAHYVHTVVSRGQRVLLLITYHYSKGDKHRGCAGFNYDTQAARASTYTILRSFFCLAALTDKELLAEFKPVLFEKRE